MPTSLDRRRFLARSAASAAALLAAREALALSAASDPGPATAAPPAPASVVRLGQNENPWGPSETAKRAAIEAVAEGNRYVLATAGFEKRLALAEGLAAEQVVLGAGSHALRADAPGPGAYEHGTAPQPAHRPHLPAVPQAARAMRAPCAAPVPCRLHPSPPPIV